MNKKQKPIPKHYQDAFKALANELIFLEPFDEKICRENISTLSKRIQEDFMKLDIFRQQKMEDELAFYAGKIDGMTGVSKPSSEKKLIPRTKWRLLSEEQSKLEDLEFMKMVTSRLDSLKKLSNADVGYYGWGFTPKLASSHREVVVGRNCFGIASSVGAYFKEKGLNVCLGITPDHPYVVTYLNGKVYLCDGGEPVEASGKIESHEYYEVCFPDELLQKVIMIFDFDHAVLYEILENFDVLRQLSLGENHTCLPDTYDPAMEIIAKHKKLIERISWKDLQLRLFSHIATAFKMHRRQWNAEIDRIAAIRVMRRLIKEFNKWFNHALTQIAPTGSTEEEKRAIVMPILRNHYLHRTFNEPLNDGAKMFLTVLDHCLLDQRIYYQMRGYMEHCIKVAWEWEELIVPLTDKPDFDIV